MYTVKLLQINVYEGIRLQAMSLYLMFSQHTSLDTIKEQIAQPNDNHRYDSAAIE